VDLWPERRRRGEAGLSLLEVVISIVVLLLVLVPISYVLGDALKSAGNAIHDTTALSVAEGALESLNKQIPPDNSAGVPNVNNVIPEPSQNVSGILYTVTAVYSWTTSGGNQPDLCTTGVVPQVIAVTVKVTWGTSGVVTDTTVLDYPPSSVPVDGFIAQQINGDPSGNPGTVDATDTPWGGNSGRVRDVVVTFVSTGGTSITAHPDANGCAFVEAPPTSAATDPAGTYTVTVNQPTSSPVPFVAPPSTPGATGTTYVTATGLSVSTDEVATATPAQWDEGAHVGLSLPNSTSSVDGVFCPNVLQLQCVAFGQAPTAATDPSGSLGVVATANVYSGTSWNSSATALAGVSRIESMACGSVCIGVGYSSGSAQNAATVVPGNPSLWSLSPLPTGVADLTQIQCPLPTVCVAIGTSTTGPALVVATISGSSVSWTNETNGIPVGVTGLNQIQCSSGVMVTCMTIGTTSTGPSILAGAISISAQTWVPDPLPTALANVATTLSQLNCASATACVAIGQAATGPIVVAGATQSLGTQQWVSDPLPATPAVTGLTQLNCSNATCTFIGTASGVPVVLAGKATALVQPLVSQNLPAGVAAPGTTLTQLSCSGAVACVAIGQSATTPVIVAGPSSVTPGASWYLDTYSSSSTPVTPRPSSLSQIVCPPAGSACIAIGTTGGSAGGATAEILTGALGPSTSRATEAFSSSTVTGGGINPVWISGVACYGSTNSCAVSGATQTGAVLLNATSPNAGGTSWTATSPSGLGLTPANLPVTVTSTESTYGTTTVCGPSTLVSSCGTWNGPLFPYSKGYSIGAGTCLAELSNASAEVPTVPGTTSGNEPDVALPMGLLSVQVVSGGVPVSGAVVSVTVADPSPANSNCNTPSPATTTTYSMPPTGPDGLTRLALIYETYSITMQLGTAKPVDEGSVTLYPTSAVFTTNGPSFASTTFSLPNAVVL
jgi:Tfp pilus assembly protein PilX